MRINTQEIYERAQRQKIILEATLKEFEDIIQNESLFRHPIQNYASLAYNSAQRHLDDVIRIIDLIDASRRKKA